MRSNNQLRLRGPRPPPLTLSKSCTQIFKKSTNLLHPIPCDRRPPVIVYLRSPKIIHVRPEEFKSFVQRLTGNGSATAAAAAFCSAADRPGTEEFVSACNCISS